MSTCPDSDVIENVDTGIDSDVSINPAAVVHGYAVAHVGSVADDTVGYVAAGSNAGIAGEP